VITCGAILAWACGTPGEVGLVRSRPGAEGQPPAAHGWVAGTSADGTWRVRWRTEPSPIPINEPFRLIVEVAGARDPDAALDELTLELDAGMPAHGHGLQRVPRVTRAAAGRFTADGLLFHMPGAWELYLDVAREGIAERAQFSVVVD
jgi:hypothetical protein